MMGILSKKSNYLLRSLSSNSNSNSKFNLKRIFSTSCSSTDVNSPSPHFPHCHTSRPETTAASVSKLLVKQYLGKDRYGKIKYEFTVLSPENLSSHNYCIFENPWLDNYAEFAPTCNGLLYVYNKSGDAGVWNPSTEEGLVLPSHGKPKTAIVDVSAFGYDSKSRDYKVVRFVSRYIREFGLAYFKNDVPDCTIGVELYSFKSNSWKWISEEVVFDFYSPPVYVNGRAYWLCDGFILKFDFADESISRIDWPPIGKIPEGSLFVMDLVEFDGSLAAIVYPSIGIHDPCESHAKKSFEVWVMTGGGVWSKELIVPPCEAKRPMVMWGNSQMIFESVVKSDTLLAYDLHTNEFKEHVIRGRSGNFEFTPCFESRLRGDEEAKHVEFIPYVERVLPIDHQLQVKTRYHDL